MAKFDEDNLITIAIDILHIKGLKDMDKLMIWSLPLSSQMLFLDLLPISSGLVIVLVC